MRERKKRDQRERRRGEGKGRYLGELNNTKHNQERSSGFHRGMVFGQEYQPYL